jgi:hypothetical protein
MINVKAMPQAMYNDFFIDIFTFPLLRHFPADWILAGSAIKTMIRAMESRYEKTPSLPFAWNEKLLKRPE